MSNLDKLRQLDSKEFWNKILSLKNGLSEYIDYTAWLDSDDEDIKHFLRSTETVIIYPSDAEVKAFVNECVFSKGSCTEEDIKNYKEQHKVECPILEHTRIYETDYLTVANLETMQIMKVPRTLVGAIEHDR